jgi:hypothetical protein
VITPQGRVVLEVVVATDRLLAVLDELRCACVAEARRQGKSWADIGAALGVSRQAAWERFGRG